MTPSNTTQESPSMPDTRKGKTQPDEEYMKKHLPELYADKQKTHTNYPDLPFAQTPPTRSSAEPRATLGEGATPKMEGIFSTNKEEQIVKLKSAIDNQALMMLEAVMKREGYGKMSHSDAIKWLCRVYHCFLRLPEERLWAEHNKK